MNSVISESSYKLIKGQLSKGILGKCPNYGLFPVIPLQNSIGKNNGSLNMTALPKSML